ncbi:hypothetical protein [Salana multivorans]
MTAQYVLSLADMYVDDERFRANYTGESLDDVPHGPELSVTRSAPGSTVRS